MTKERPILFSAPMVRALLDGSKTQTRRAFKVQPTCLDDTWRDAPDVGTSNGKSAVQCNGLQKILTCPYGKPGGSLWVRENGWQRPERTPEMMRNGADTWEPYYFDADGLTEQDSADFKAWGFKRRPSIFMPRWASRITLEVTAVRVERLQDISGADAIAEGIDRTSMFPWRPGETVSDDADVSRYAVLWNFLNGRGSWDQDPWVWVIEFKKLTP